MTTEPASTPSEAVQYWFDAATERREERDRLRAVVARISQMADAWEQRLPEVIRTPAVVSAIRAALEPAAAAPVAAPPTTEQTALRDRIAAAIWERQNPGRRYADCEHPWQADAEDDADAVLAALFGPIPAGIDVATWTAIRAVQLMNEASRQRDGAVNQAAALAADLRYVLGHGEPGHDHEQPGVWDTSGEPCTHCARLAVAQQNLAAYDAGAVLPAPADRAATLREAADAVDELCEKTDANVYRAAVRAITAPAVSSRPGTEQEA